MIPATVAVIAFAILTCILGALLILGLCRAAAKRVPKP